MKTITTILRLTLLACLFTGVFAGSSNTKLDAQEAEVIKLTLHARAVPKNPDALRLFPRETELRDGNAAIELLRMPWNESNFMELQSEKMAEWQAMEGDDPELVEYEDSFFQFKEKMRRAAYTRDADWDYPLGEQPTITILLPDVQGMRTFAGRIMSLWIKIQIAKGNLKAAEEGVLIQMSCARHVSRTPFSVCQLVGAGIAGIGLGQLENLIQHPESENYYYALSMVPKTLGDYQATVDIDNSFARNSMPSLAAPLLPPPGDPKWKIAYAEFHAIYIPALIPSEEIDPEVLKRHAQVVAKELPALTEFSEEMIAKMSKEEIVTRWLLANIERIDSQYTAATRLPTHQAVPALLKLDQEIENLSEKPAFIDIREDPNGGLPVTELVHLHAPQAYLGCHRFGRQAKLLQIVEAIRDYASKHENRLPDSLADIELPLPLDPFTNKPAEYELEEGVALLRWPLVPNGGDKLPVQNYELRMADSK